MRPSFFSALTEKVIKRNKTCLLILVLVHRHDAGTLFFCPVAATHSRTDCRRLPVCELRGFLHRDRPVCDECRCVRVPAAASSQEGRRAKEVTPIRWSSLGDGGRVNKCLLQKRQRSGGSGLSTRRKQVLFYQVTLLVFRFPTC